jgi:DNA-binding HxlR family transcriptional regulator
VQTEAQLLSTDEALERIAQILGCKWSVKILYALNEGERRPSELLREWEAIAPRVLHRCLNRLELDGLLSKQTFAEVPLRTEYELTEQGREFVALLNSAQGLATQWTGSQRVIELTPDDLG